MQSKEYIALTKQIWKVIKVITYLQPLYWRSDYIALTVVKSFWDKDDKNTDKEANKDQLSKDNMF